MNAFVYGPLPLRVLLGGIKIAAQYIKCQHSMSRYDEQLFGLTYPTEENLR